MKKRFLLFLASVLLFSAGPLARQATSPKYVERVALNDLAPTLATLIEVDAPGGSSGRVLTEALDTIR